MAVGALAAERNEEGAGDDGARVDSCAGDGGDRGRSQETAADRGQQLVEKDGRRHMDHAADYRRV
jgi:hypothetical protein